MARPRPKLEWEELAQMPRAVLLRIAETIEIGETGPVTMFGSVGGSRRQVLPVRPAGFSRKSGTVCRTFVFPHAIEHGNAAQSMVSTTRVTYTTQELRMMLEGQVKPPAGLTERMISHSIEAMEKREHSIHHNNSRAARHYLQKLLAD